MGCFSRLVAASNDLQVGRVDHSSLVGKAILNIPNVAATLESKGKATCSAAMASRRSCAETGLGAKFLRKIACASCSGSNPRDAGRLEARRSGVIREAGSCIDSMEKSASNP